MLKLETSNVEMLNGDLDSFFSGEPDGGAGSCVGGRGSGARPSGGGRGRRLAAAGASGAARPTAAERAVSRIWAARFGGHLHES